MLLAGLITRELTENRLFSLAAGLILAASPAQFMNAVAGMETPLFGFETALLIWLCLRRGFRPILLGALSGLLFLTRPEGLGLAALTPLAFILSRQASGRKLLAFVISFGVPALPYLAWVHHHTGHFLPTTYLGKIMAADPALLDRPWPEKFLFAFLPWTDGWNRLIAPFQLLGWVLLAATIYLGLALLWDLVKRRENFRPGLFVLIGLLFLPAIYGFGFPVNPAFGGYYHRYIAVVMLSFAIGGCVGLFRIYAMAGKPLAPAVTSPSHFPGRLRAFRALPRYGFFPQWQEGRKVFVNEVALNEGLRRQAADWIREHTAKDAKVLVGYTGLGVVGGGCGRYVYDLGALINPDIFSYYQDTKPLTEKRWLRVLDYIRDHGITWYVTFHYPYNPRSRTRQQYATERSKRKIT